VGVLLISYRVARMLSFSVKRLAYILYWAAPSGNMNEDFKVIGGVSNSQYIYSYRIILQTSIQANNQLSRETQFIYIF